MDGGKGKQTKMQNSQLTYKKQNKQKLKQTILQNQQTPACM